MKFRLIVLVALFTLVLTACSLAEDITPPPGYVSPTPAPTLGVLYPTQPPSPARGAVVYAERCLACHGENGLGNGPWAPQMPVAVPAIGLRDISSQSTPADWFTVISQGNQDRGMPSYSSLPESQRWDVLSYVYSLSATSEELQRAATLYAANCVSCHGPQGRGDGQQAAGMTPAATNFADQQFMSQATGTGLYRAIAEGVAPSMPAFATLAESDIRALTAYLRTLTFDLSAPTARPPPSPTPGLPTPPVSAALSASPAATSTGATSSGTTTPGTAAPASETATTPGVQTGTPAALTGTVTGTVVTGSGAALPAGLTVNLLGSDPDSSGSSTQVLNLSMPLQPDGSFLFENVAMAENRAFIAEVKYKDVSYQSDSGVVQPGATQLELPAVTIYDTTDDIKTLQLVQAHIYFDFSDPKNVQVVEVYVITNPGDKSVVIPTTGESLPFIQLPKGAVSVNNQLTQDSAPLFATTNGFALAPTSKQYGFVASFTLPYDKKLELSQPFVLSALSVIVLSPEGVKVSSSQLTDQGTQDFQGTTYQLYETQNLAADSSLSMTISGQPKTASSITSSSSRTGLIIGLSVFGLAFVGAGIWLFVRDRKRAKEEEEEGDEDEKTAEDALGDNPDSLTDAIIALDEQYKAGDISKEAYQKRRAELKNRLKEIL